MLLLAPYGRSGATRLKQLSIPKIAIEAGKMTEVVRDVLKGVQTSKQDVYEQKKEEFKPIREEKQKEN